MRRIFLFVAVLLLVSVLVVEAKKEKSKFRGRNCSKPCNKKLKPVCGSDGKTYSNQCVFGNARCEALNKTGSVLKIKSQGPCENSTAKNSKAKQPKQCLAGLADCDKVGNSSKHAVCGSNNITYTSFCSFRVARCQAKQNDRNLTMVHKGECGKPKVKKSEMCPVVSQCDNQEQPICGSNGKIYKNTCLFIVAKCQARRQNKKLTLKKKGACDSSRPSFKPCPKSCPSKERPVCGSDKKTYKNGCYLAAAKCALPKKDRGSLRLEYNGPCGAPTTPKPCPRWEDCKIVDKPVCGSDGNTYPNICRLRVAMCHARRNKHRPIKLKYRNKCRNVKRKKGKKNTKDRSGRKGKKERRG